MKKVIFTGFFGMKQKHAEIYISMWKKIGYGVSYEPYSTTDVLLAGNKFKEIRNNFKPQHKHYDAAYCISGGCLHMHNLICAKNNFTIDKVIFDSGPYLFNSKHIDNYIHKTYFNKYNQTIPFEKMLTNMYEMRKIYLESYNKEYYNTLLNKDLPKLILLGKEDNIIYRPFVTELINNSHHNNIVHHEFEKGNHANLYKYNREDYIDIVNNFCKK
jgi:hypothetical protein